MTATYARPEAWHARVLRDEVEQLTVAVRILEFADGFREGQGVPILLHLDEHADTPGPVWLFEGAVQ